jgi:hypothetical protein
MHWIRCSESALKLESEEKLANSSQHFPIDNQPLKSWLHQYGDSAALTDSDYQL